MNISQKYGSTYHYPFSPGTTSDDRIKMPNARTPYPKKFWTDHCKSWKYRKYMKPMR
ncbi:hypothetical protein [Adhaeribacter pallidiroseus]|uniref:hypothetical protein n=1 Tax=Adhaeribacter pallidiroseus TaxID=2072847 RepID=UPI001F2A8F85|nr:hypothetical protein [Adhaeribacter pallidiroseus]